MHNYLCLNYLIKRRGAYFCLACLDAALIQGQRLFQLLTTEMWRLFEDSTYSRSKLIQRITVSHFQHLPHLKEQDFKF